MTTETTDQTKRTTITPVHLGIAVAAIIAAIFLLPFINDKWSTAYPPAGTTERRWVEECNKLLPGIRWQGEKLAECKAAMALMKK